MAINSRCLIECENLYKIYKTKETEVVALQGLDLFINKGEILVIIGNSGSGKSTLLNLLGGLDRPSAGNLFVNGKDLLKFNEKQLDDYRKNTVGFIWQNNSRNLIPYLSAKENIEVPLIIAKKNKIKNRANDLICLVGLDKKKNHKLFQLSGGEQQRVAIAIALANEPDFLLADEPTGSVDNNNMHKIMELFYDLNRKIGMSIIIVSHDMQLSKMVNRVIAIRDGRTSSEFIRKNTYMEVFQDIDSNKYLNEDTHDELAIIDNSGRLQIPKEYIRAAKLDKSNRVKVKFEDGRIIISAPKEL